MYLLSLLMFACSSICAEPNPQQAYILYNKQQREWAVLKDNQIKAIQRCFVDKILRDVPAEKAEQVLQHIAVRATQMDNGEYALHGHVRGLGGGVAAAWICYWGAKILFYSCVSAAASKVVKHSGQGMQGMVGEGMNRSLQAGVGYAANAAGGPTFAAVSTFVGDRIADSGLAEGAGLAAMATVASTQGINVSAGEAIANAAFAFGMALPF